MAVDYAGEKLPEEWRAGDVKGYLPFKYAIKDEKLTIWFMDGDASKKLVAAGELKGMVKKGFVTTVRLSEPTDRLRKFVQTDAGKSLFTEKTKVVLKRVKW
jgi:hypothetical protein